MLDIDYALEKVNQKISHAQYQSFSLAAAADFMKFAQKKVAILERLWVACDKLGIYVPMDEESSDLPWLEKLVSGGYRHEKEKVSESIVSAIAEVRESEYESERDESVAAITAAGFEEDYEEDGCWRRGLETLTIEGFHKSQYDWWYTFEYNHPDGTRVSGKSGEFSKLLEAIRAGAETSS